MSIFFDTSIHNEGKKNICIPQDLTQHYRKEISDFLLDWVYIASNYNDIVNTIEAYKYRSDRQYVDKYVDILSKIVEKHWLFADNVIFVGVPMHWSRYMIRGFNHIDLLVSWLSYRFWSQKIKPILAHWTRRQSKLTKVKRLKNREHAFSLRPRMILPKTVILVDDIISTGSTANACAKILKGAGVEKVYSIFIASNQ